MPAEVKIHTEQLKVLFQEKEILRGIRLDIYKNEILSIIGPASSGKTTFLRALNRMLDLSHSLHISGDVQMDGFSIYAPHIKVSDLRRRIGMVFATPVPFPASIFNNIAMGFKFSSRKKKSEIRAVVEKSLKDAYLWDEVRDRLDTSALNLSGGQQQRLCLARALAQEPEVLLLDEPCSGLDPISTAKIEDALKILKSDYTVVLVTNNTKQAARVSDRTAFFLHGEIVECGETPALFTRPQDKRTDDYISGRFG